MPQNTTDNKAINEMVIIFFFMLKYKKNSTDVEFCKTDIPGNYLSNLIKKFD